MTSGGAVNISQEQLQQVAERLGERHLKCTHDGEWESHYPEGNGWQTRWRSDGDLLLSILNRAAEMGAFPSIRQCKNGNDTDWECDMQEVPLVRYSYADTPLAAAILAFIELPIHASQGDA